MAGISLAVGVLDRGEALVPAVDAWTEGRELWFGAGVVAVVLTAFVSAMLAARRRALVSVRA